MLRGNSDFRWYFLGSVTSDFGTWLQNSAQVLLAYQLAHSVFTVGLVTFAQFTSPLVLGPWAGVRPTSSAAAARCFVPRSSQPWWRPRWLASTSVAY